MPADGGTPVGYQTGFTKIIDIAFGKDGSLYVLEISAIRLARRRSLHPALCSASPRVAARPSISPRRFREGFVAPGGIAVGSDGALYITVNSISCGGTVRL